MADEENEENEDDRGMFEKYLAPNYPYHKGISTPSDLDMSPDGGFDTLRRDTVGLINYGELMIYGTGNANKKKLFENKNIPLGDRIFVDTPGKCYPVNLDGKLIDDETNEVLEDQSKNEIRVDRAVYIDHIPTGYIPGMGNLGAMRGMVPGLLGNLLELNPVTLLKAMVGPSTPPCLRTKMKTVRYKEGNSNSNRHEVKYDEFWVAVDDLEALNACSFKDAIIDGKTFNNTNPITKESVDCPGGDEGFNNLFNNRELKKLKIGTKNKPLANLFNVSFGLLLAYILFKVLKKEI